VREVLTLSYLVQGLMGVLCAIKCPLLLTLDPGSSQVKKNLSVIIEYWLLASENQSIFCL